MSEQIPESAPTDPEEENEKRMTHGAGSEGVQELRLTEKQRLFIDFFTGESRGNGSDAARRAGYCVPRQEAYRLLQSADIRACIRARAQQVMSEYETIDHMATFIRQGPGHPIERNAWVNAVEKMMKYHGMLVDKLEHSGVIEQQVRQVVVHVNAASK